MFPSLTHSPLPTALLLLLSLQTLLVAAGPAMAVLRVGSALSSLSSGSNKKNGRSLVNLGGLNPVERRAVQMLAGNREFVRAVRDARLEQREADAEAEPVAYSIYERDAEAEQEMYGLYTREAEAEAEAEAFW